MRLPNKATPYAESVLPLFPRILDEVSDEAGKAPLDLLSVCGATDVSSFIEAMDCLYALGKIEFSDDGEHVRYVD